jgi:hypothetical protein
MIISRPRKSDAVLVWVGVAIFLLLVLAILFVVRRQPQIPRQAPNAAGTAMRVSGFFRVSPLSV